MNQLDIHRKTQDLSSYTPQDYETWERLLQIQLTNIVGKASQEFIDGLAKVESFIQTLPNIAEVSHFLDQQIGWQLLPVEGLIDSEDYFFLLAHRHFPVATFIRDGNNLNYSPVPDLWHDIFGHIPLLFSPEYAEFVEYLGHQFFVYPFLREKISRLYWYTIEAGVCNENGDRKVYGASQLSSIEEISYAVSEKPTVSPFDLGTVLHSHVRIYEMQHHIFEISSFGYLKVVQNHFQAYREQCVFQEDDRLESSRSQLNF
jgi:phenylalanine-4-hydroxylase